MTECRSAKTDILHEQRTEEQDGAGVDMPKSIEGSPCHTQCIHVHHFRICPVPRGNLTSRRIFLLLQLAGCLALHMLAGIGRAMWKLPVF